MFRFFLNQVAALDISNFFKKRFQRRCFSVNIAKFLKKLILKKICERLLLNNVKRNYSSLKIVKLVLNVSQNLQENAFTGESFLINISCRMQLKPIFIQKEVPTLVFSWQVSEISKKNFFKERKKALLWEKKHCYKKRGSDIYRKSNYATFFVTSPRFLYSSKALAQFIVTTGLSVSDGPISILSDIVISLRKSHEIIFVTYFWKTKNTCERCLRHLFWDMPETS